MAIDAAGRVTGGGTPVKIKEREEAVGVKSPCHTRKMKFHEGLAAGMAPAKALETCEPSRAKNITFTGLKACVDAGLTKEEIAKGFGTTKGTLDWKASQIKFKFRRQHAAVAPENTKPVAAAEDVLPAPVNAINPGTAHKPMSSELEEFCSDKRLPPDENHIDKLLEALHNSDGPVTQPKDEEIRQLIGRLVADSYRLGQLLANRGKIS